MCLKWFLERGGCDGNVASLPDNCYAFSIRCTLPCLASTAPVTPGVGPLSKVSVIRFMSACKSARSNKGRRFHRGDLQRRKRGASDQLALTRCVCAPSPVIDMSTWSPSFRNCGGFIPSPTPAGVPVMIRSPGRSVMNWLT